MSDYCIDEAFIRHERILTARRLKELEELEKLEKLEGESRTPLVVAGVVLLLAIAAMLYLNLGYHYSDLFVERSIHQAHDKHLDLLEETRENLKGLTEYVDGQSRLVRETNQLIAELQSQRDKIKPILETEVQAVNALFHAQEERSRKERLGETILSFILGVVSSIAATFLWEAVSKRRRRWRNKQAPNLGNAS